MKFNQCSGPLEFRSLNYDELYILNKVYHRHHLDFRRYKITVAYVEQGNFTLCIVHLEAPNKNFYRKYGMTKRNPYADDYNIERSHNISFFRALKGPLYEIL